MPNAVSAVSSTDLLQRNTGLVRMCSWWDRVETCAIEIPKGYEDHLYAEFHRYRLMSHAMDGKGISRVALWMVMCSLEARVNGMQSLTRPSSRTESLVDGDEARWPQWDLHVHITGQGDTCISS